MKSRSNTLFHFTSEFIILVDILENGFWPRYCLEDISWLEFSGDPEVAFPMVCFCDIPFTRINDHVDRYGKYGIGISREWASNNDVSPVRYVNHKSRVAALYKDISNSAQAMANDSDKDSFFHILQQLTSWTKPSSGKMQRGDETIDLDFYLESEWRYVPNTDLLRDTNFNNPRKLEKANKLTREKFMLKFEIRDLAYIFVENDSVVPKLYDGNRSF